MAAASAALLDPTYRRSAGPAAGASPPAIDYTKLVGDIFGGGGGSAAAHPATTVQNGKAMVQVNGKWVAQNTPEGQAALHGSQQTGGFMGGQATGGGGSSSGGGGGSAAPGPPGTVTNTAQMDPYLKNLAEKMTTRINDPTDNSKRAIDTMGLAMRDLEAGQAKELKAGLASRGMSGSGLETAGLKDLARGTTGKIAQGAEDITLQRQRDQDALLSGASGSLGAVGDAARQDRDLAGRLYIEDQQNRRAQEEAQMNRQIAILNLIGNLGRAA